MSTKPLKQGDLISIPGYICISKSGKVEFWEYDMTSQGYTVVCPYEIITVVPIGFAISGTELDAIEAAIELNKKEFQEKQSVLRRRLKELKLSTPKDASNANP